MRRAAFVLAMATASALFAAYMTRTLAEPTDAKGAESELRQAASLSDAPVPLASAVADAAVSKGEDGHYWAEAKVQGRHVRFLVDTGASTVALTAADAQRLGLDVRGLTYDRPVATASGRAMAASVTLDYVSVSGARVDDVEALVMREGLETSLLGMTYLGRLSRFEATRDALILRR